MLGNDPGNGGSAMGIGPGELIVLVACFLLVALVGVVAIVAVLKATKKNSPDSE